MLEAAKKAGFPNVEGMDEAQAAITAVMVQSETYLSQKGYLYDGVPVNILMIDMGAGTTDLVLCRYTPGGKAGYEVLSAWPRDGKTLFGGREIEELLQDYLRSKLPEEDADAVMKRCGLEKFKSWKETNVSPALKRDQAVTEFYEFDEWVEGLEIEMEDYSLNRAELENLTLNYLRGFPRLVNGCLSDAGISGSEVDLVLLTGGHSQWYFVSEQLTGKMSQCGEIDLGKIKADPGRIIPVPRPQETVALGLVYSPLMEQIQFAAQSESKPEPKPTPKPEPRPTPNSQPATDSEVWDESMRILPLTPEEEFEFQEIESGYTIKKYLGHREVVSIPAQYRGKPVIAIEKRAFSKRSGNALELKEVEIPGSCRVIGESAFFGSHIYRFILHKGVQIIGFMAFSDNPLLSVIQLPKGLLKIDEYAFSSCDLKKIDIPDSCVEICQHAFLSNKNLSDVLFSPESSIRELDKCAFDYTNVHKVKLPVKCKCDVLIKEGVKLGGFFKKAIPAKYIEIERY